MRYAALAVMLMAAAGPLTGQAPITYERYRLANGLNVFLVEDHDTPIATVNVWYNVGSRNERLGRSGFAHLFEHMMFQGSANVGKGEHFQLIERAGGSMNGTTNEDRTAYFETLPANRLNLGLWLEADRMRSLAVTDDNFENQRETVKEERRLRVDNQPYGKAFSDGLTLIYDSTECFPYAHTVIGSMDDLDAAATPDVQAFFDLYYTPSNATLTVVGDFDPAEAKRLIEQYFGDIPRGADQPGIECAHAYGSAGGRRHVWEDRLANIPLVLMTFLTPPHSHEDTPPLTLLATILAGGESSRLNRSLVRDQQLALASGGFSSSRRGPSQFIAFAIANQGIAVDTIEAALRAEIDRIIDEGVTPEELDKARNDFRAGNIFGRQTTMSVAQRIQHFVHYHDSVDEINVDLDRYMAVTAEDIQRAARTYLATENSLVLVVVPQQQEGVQP
ncbi:MAG: insulinase family protein [Gemmatimonadetes bacterium]|nr:insulinase family protein [Gemmatimonadota bacterium]